MPGRTTPLITDEIYHIVNRGIDRRTTFSGLKENSRAKEGLGFYRFQSLPCRLSFFFKKSLEEQEKIMEEIEKKGKKLIELICFCLMPNHFHLLLKQKIDDGISKFMSNFQNSYTRYFNTKHRRKGPLFYDQFKAVRIETDEQLIHVSRYIHLNPYSSYVIKDFKNIKDYLWSSLPDYLSGKKGICETNVILDFFKNKKEYFEFIYNQADYQRELDRIKHLDLEGD